MKGSYLVLFFLLFVGKAQCQSQKSLFDVPRPDTLPTPLFTPPPEDALVLFDGSSKEHWTGPNGRRSGWKVQKGSLVVGGLFRRSLYSKIPFGDVQLHLEWRTPANERGSGQNKGNSGVKLMGLYEVQILESYENQTEPDRQAGSIYNQYAPLVNASLPPGAWQSFDIYFTAPVFDSMGNLEEPARITVLSQWAVNSR